MSVSSFPEDPAYMETPQGVIVIITLIPSLINAHGTFQIFQIRAILPVASQGVSRSAIDRQLMLMIRNE